MVTAGALDSVVERERPRDGPAAILEVGLPHHAGPRIGVAPALAWAGFRAGVPCVRRFGLVRFRNRHVLHRPGRRRSGRIRWR